MSPDDIQSLRKKLGCSARELAGALGVEQSDVMAWEKGELFPTKRLVDAMKRLEAEGPSSVPKKRRGKSETPMQVLANPDFHRLLRKLLAHGDLRARALELAASYADPLDD